MKIVSLLIAMVISVVLSLFSARNPEVVQIDLLVGRFSIALSMAILGSAFLGALAGGVIVAFVKGEGKERTPREKGN